MPSQIEQALRAGVLTREAGQADDIKNKASERAKQLVMGNLRGTDKGIASQIAAHSDAIGLAMVVISVGIAAISSVVNGTKDRAHRSRMDYETHRLTTTESIRVLKDKEESQRSRYEKTIIGFLKASQVDPAVSLKEYLGYEEAILAEDKTATVYTILPYCLMSEGIEKRITGDSKLEHARTNITLFISSEFPSDIARIDTDFQMDSKAKSFFSAAVEGDGYLDDRRIPRFIMIALANLLWHLQYPVDRKTGFPLSTNRCIELCRNAKIYINKLLNTETSPYIINNPSDKYRVVSYMRTVEIEITRLYGAYRDEKIHELKIRDLKNTSHSVLRTMDQSMLMLIYRRHNPLTGKKEFDPKFANEMARRVGYLNQILQQNNTLLAYFKPYQAVAKRLLINPIPLTVVDVLIIFSTLSSTKRKQLLSDINQQQVSTAFECIETLTLFYDVFIKPIRQVSKEELCPSFLDHKHQQVGFLTACRLIPLTTLVIEDYQIDVNMDSMLALAEEANVTGPIMTGNEQSKAINKEAASGTSGTFTWKLSIFINSGKGKVDAIDRFPHLQYRMTQITQLIDSIADLIDNYRNILLYPKFKDFLLKCLTRVDRECHLLMENIELMDHCLSTNEGLSRSLQDIIHPMVSKLMLGLGDFTEAATSFENVITAPDFIQKQKNLLSTKLHTIREQFLALFGAGSEIEEISNDCYLAPEAPLALPLVSPEFVNANQVVALGRLIDHCYKGMSFQSRMGHKGKLLQALSNKFDENANVTEGQIKHVILELTRIVASYRPTYFFQAAYGQTRSAQVLIAAMQDPILNGVLPLNSIIFDKPKGCMTMKTSDISARLKDLCQINTWREDSTLMALS